jgi:hypothetical protein
MSATASVHWGAWHRESVLGPERAENIPPAGWVLAQNMIFGSHHDVSAGCDKH